MNENNFKIYKNLFLVFSTIILIAFPIMSLDFGITWDEWVNNHYGILICKFFQSGFRDRSCMSFSDLYLYGGLVDVLGVIFYYVFNWFGEYESRHIIISVFGSMAVIYTGLTAKMLGNWRTGLVALLLIVISPHFLGHSMNNPKDIPFAAGYIASLYYLLIFFKEFPHPKIKTSLLLTLSISLCINVRVGGLLLLMYLFLFSILYLMYDNYFSGKKSIYQPFIISVLIIAIASYFGGLLFWPYGLINPLVNPVKTLLIISKYSAVNQPNLFEGEIISSLNVPWYYILKLIWLTNPIIVCLGLAFFFVIFTKSNITSNKFQYFIVLFSLFFPILFTILMHSVLHDGWRHFLFIYPLIIVLSAIAWDYFFSLNKPVYKIICLTLFLYLIIEPVMWNIRNYRHQYAYFNPFSGGINKAFTNYETDYWGNGLRYGAEWLGENYGQSIGDSILIYTNANPECSFYYLKKYGKFKMTRKKTENWKFAILTIRGNIKNGSPDSWPPRETIHKIKADSVTICAVVKK